LLAVGLPMIFKINVSNFRF